jgi:hypothetical protein
LPLFKPIISGIDERETLRYAGLRPGAELPPALVKKTGEEALIYAEPAGVWELFDYDPPWLKKGDVAYQPAGAQLCRHLRGARRVALLAATVGEALEERVNELFAAGAYSGAVLLDAAATAAVEQAADGICACIGAAAQKEGLRAGVRFSPGYGDWPLSEQPQLLRLTGASAIGLTVTSSLMLKPRKSITAALGLKPPSEPAAPFGCDACAHSNCQWRKR